jgi:hypothetical protein
MDEIILANIDWLVANENATVSDFGDVLDSSGMLRYSLTELATPGLTPATVKPLVALLPEGWWEDPLGSPTLATKRLPGSRP